MYVYFLRLRANLVDEVKKKNKFETGLVEGLGSLLGLVVLGIFLRDVVGWLVVKLGNLILT